MSIQQTTYAVARADLAEAVHEYDPSQDGFIADKVLPLLPVKKKAATMSVITRENLKRVDAKHANGAAFNRVTLISEDLAYACADYGLEGTITDEDRENYIDDYDAELETATDVKRKLAVEREIRVKDAIFNTTTFTGADLYTDNSSAPWDNIASGIIAQVAAAKELVRQNTGVKPDSLIVGAVTLNNMLKNTGIIARFVGAVVVTEQMIRDFMSAIFGLKELIVGDPVYDGAIEGQDFSASDIWPDDYAMVAKIQQGSTKVNPGLGRSPIWTPMSETAEEVTQYREEQTESDIIKVRHYLTETIFDPYFGHLIKIDT